MRHFPGYAGVVKEFGFWALDQEPSIEEVAEKSQQAKCNTDSMEDVQGEQAGLPESHESDRLLVSRAAKEADCDDQKACLQPHEGLSTAQLSACSVEDKPAQEAQGNAQTSELPEHGDREEGKIEPKRAGWGSFRDLWSGRSSEAPAELRGACETEALSGDQRESAGQAKDQGHIFANGIAQHIPLCSLPFYFEFLCLFSRESSGMRGRAHCQNASVYIKALLHTSVG